MYESRKNMGDVCKDVSGAIEKRKDVIPEEHEHHRNSESRPNETKFHIPDPTELGIEDYVMHDLGKILDGICIQNFEEALKGVMK